MLRFYAMLVCFLLSIQSFALPCKNGRIIYKGDSLKTVLEQCGQPISNRIYERTVPVLTQWTYYKKNNQTNTKIDFLLKNNHVLNIAVSSTINNATYTQNFSSSNACDAWIRQYDNASLVLSRLIILSYH